jgi:beta-barrel assembly-enhancing protease
MKFVLALTVLPLLAQQPSSRGVNLYSIEKERVLGEQYAAEMRKQSKPFDNPAVTAYVKRLVAELSAHIDQRSFEFNVEVVSDDERAEPVPLPGGFLFVPTRAFLAAQDEAEFIGLLAHSMAHIALRHGTRTATRSQIVNMASIPLIYMGGPHGAHAESHRPAAMLIPVTLMSFQRMFELDADRFGVGSVSRAGYDPTGLARYLARTQQSTAEPATLSPLPPLDTRLANLREAAAALPATVRSSNEEFLALRQTLAATTGGKQRAAPTLRISP